ncbi:hypothetical protein [Streptomyces sp. CFMR 7]|uniref:hypothetical protein n=1 Tax=Streptomyces sp. CFMR 7 TaxID=1649184 RepID=UPI0006AD1642|nr:hypothetical protein [Streptomyces sp. CFMR 7]ALC32350.1 hypothetical protein ABE83_34970 [Streptomyces sp. CFMR 7]
MSDRVWDRKTRQLIESLRRGAGLETGLASGPYGVGGRVCGRYECRACGQDLIARSLSPTASNRPHFRHKSGSDCPATREQREKAYLDDQVVIDLRDALVRAWPGVPVDLVPVHTPDPGDGDGGPRASAPQPPAIVVCGPEGTVVVERVRALPGPDRVRARSRAVRAQFGPGAAHVWFLAQDPLQFARCRTLQVRPRGLGRADHATVAPTEEQLAIVAAGGGVYWLDGQQVLIPYGVHDFVHTPREGEAWDFGGWRRDWPKDWWISHPVPAADATRWGLVPLSLHQLTSTKASFSLREAREVMQRLEDVERARWRRRRADARELHASRQAPPAPAPPSPFPQPAVLPARSDAPEAARPAGDPPLPPPRPGADGDVPPGVPGTGSTGDAATSAAAAPAPAGRDGQQNAPVPVIPPLPRHPPLIPPPPPPTVLPPQKPGPGKRRGLRGVLRNLLRREKD